MAASAIACTFAKTQIPKTQASAPRCCDSTSTVHLLHFHSLPSCCCSSFTPLGFGCLFVCLFVCSLTCLCACLLARVVPPAKDPSIGRRDLDILICGLMSERKLGPPLLGVFPEGRIEEFVESRTLVVNATSLSVCLSVYLFVSPLLCSPLIYSGFLCFLVFTAGNLAVLLKQVKELKNPLLSMKIALKLRELHRMNLPLRKDNTWLYSTLQR